jgi:UDP-N-acetyl-D-galactosamine dehydrogenase
MGKFIAEKTVKLMIQQGANVKGAKVVVLGLTFKENCPDLRNSKVIDVIRELQDYGCEVTVHDPMADEAEAMREYGVTLIPWNQLPQKTDALVLAVAHRDYREKSAAQLLGCLGSEGVVIDVKSIVADAGGHVCWRL